MNQIKAFIDSLCAATDNRFNHKFIYFVGVSIVISFIELLGISILGPFIAALSDPSVITSNQYFNALFVLTNSGSKLNFIFMFGGALIAFYLIRSIMNVIYTFKINQFSSLISAHVSTKLFYHYIRLKFPVFANQNTSNMTKISINESANISYMIVGLLNLISELMLVIFIYVFLMFLNWQVTILISIFLCLLLSILYHFIVRKIRTEGYKRSESLNKMHMLLNSSFGNFKIIKMLSNQEGLKSNYQHEAQIFAHANTIHHSFSAFPKFILEGAALVVLLLSILLLLHFNQGNISQFVPTIFMFLLAFFRLLPAINKIFSSFNNIQYLLPILSDLEAEFKLALESTQSESVTFDKQIQLRDLSFSYGDKVVLDNINMHIAKNDKVMIVGQSGSGKSTLINILLRLVDNYKGQIYIDDNTLSQDNMRCFRRKIGYIPQDIYLFDDTVANNVVFGRKYDHEKLVSALKQANIYDDLVKKAGIKTEVGDNGIKLSGGQKQRVGIARALYSEPKIIIMDEATSALDNAIEKKIMDEIMSISKHKTLIVITHRLTYIDKFDRVFEMKNGNIEDVTHA